LADSANSVIFATQIYYFLGQILFYKCKPFYFKMIGITQLWMMRRRLGVGSLHLKIFRQSVQEAAKVTVVGKKLLIMKFIRIGY
jgi:hypothetical protein